MKYRVIEELEASADERFQVQASIYGHTWATRSKHADQVSAEIEMERLAAGPRVISEAESD